MLSVRKSQDRGHFDHGWLDTYHTFSFGDYHDPSQMGFRSLRVINEDRVAPGQGFGTHPHRDMEIITYVLSGALEHRDSLGTGSVIRPGDVQSMTAGRGILHSEFNPSDTQPVHLLQIWIVPDTRNLEPSYDQRTFSTADRQDRLRLVASSDGREDSLRIHQDANVYAALLSAEKTVQLPIRAGRHVWLQLASGQVIANGERLVAGDGAAVSNEQALEIKAVEPAELLLFELS